MTEIDLASSFTERVSAAPVVQQAKIETAESFPGTDPEDVELKTEPSAKSVVQPLKTATNSKVERILTDLGVGTEANVELIFENHLDCLERLIKSDRVKTFEATFETALQWSNFDSRNDLKTIISNVFEHGLA